LDPEDERILIAEMFDGELKGFSVMQAAGKAGLERNRWNTFFQQRGHL
jgi:hypothetical protein